MGISGEVPRYTGIVNCFSRVASDQGIGAFWRGNGTNIIRYFPTQAFNFAFKDSIKNLFPKADKNTEFAKFFAINMASGGLAGAGSLMIVYPLDYARTRLASDVGGKAIQRSCRLFEENCPSWRYWIRLQRYWCLCYGYHPIPWSIFRSFRYPLRIQSLPKIR